MSEYTLNECQQELPGECRNAEYIESLRAQLAQAQDKLTIAQEAQERIRQANGNLHARLVEAQAQAGAMREAMKRIHEMATFDLNRSDEWSNSNLPQIEADARAATKEMPIATCQWTEVPDEAGWWNTSCGKQWWTEDFPDTPLDAGINYCYNCGKRVEAVPLKEDRT